MFMFIAKCFKKLQGDTYFINYKYKYIKSFKNNEYRSYKNMYIKMFSILNVQIVYSALI